MTIKEFNETITVTVPLSAADHEEIHAEMIERNTRPPRRGRPPKQKESVAHA